MLNVTTICRECKRVTANRSRWCVKCLDRRHGKPKHRETRRDVREAVAAATGKVFA